MAAELLTDLHELHLQSFLRFSMLKRQQHAREILQCISDCEQHSINTGEMYSASDVWNIFGGLSQELRLCISKELENAYHSSALLIQMQLIQAQAADVTISVDTALLENEAQLQRIKACEQKAMARPAADFAIKRAGAVGLLGGVGVRTVADSAVVQQRDQLRSEVEALRSRLESLQAANSTALASKTDLAKQLADAQAIISNKEQELNQLQAAQQATTGTAWLTTAQMTQEAAAAKVAEVTRQQLDQLQHQLRAKDAQIRGAEQALAGKVQESKQWQQMKQLMQQKCQEVVELRRKLATYEPEDVMSGDAGAAPARQRPSA